MGSDSIVTKTDDVRQIKKEVTSGNIASKSAEFAVGSDSIVTLTHSLRRAAE